MTEQPLNMKLSITENILDPLAMNQSEMVGSVFDLASAVVGQGGTVTIVREYENAPATHVATFTSEKEVEEARSKLIEVQKELGGATQGL